MVGKATYVSPLRVESQYTIKELARNSHPPNKLAEKQLKRLACYWSGRAKACILFPWGLPVDGIHDF
eukprot:12397122-Alexandrium_andersonii.AAC.1